MAVLIHRASPSQSHYCSAPGSPSPSVASCGSTSSSTDLLSHACTAVRRLNFKSSNQHRSIRRGIAAVAGATPPPHSNTTAVNDANNVVVVAPAAAIVAVRAAGIVNESRSISTDSSATMNTSVDSANTATTMVTLTDNGDADDVRLKSIANPFDTTSNQTPASNQTPSSTDKEDEFYSASEDLNVIFPKDEIVLEEYDDSCEPLLQHTTVPKPDGDASGTLEDSKLPVISDDDPSEEWYHIKMRQPHLARSDSSQRKTLANKRRFHRMAMANKYSRCYFEEERVRLDKGRNSSGFAAEQMTIDSEEDSFQWDSSIASPPVPTSPTGTLTPTGGGDQPSSTVATGGAKQHFTFPPMTEANDLLNEFKIKHRRQSQTTIVSTRQSPAADASSAAANAGRDLFAKKQRVDCGIATVAAAATTTMTATSSMTSREKRDEERTINKTSRNCNESGVATIVVQQPSVTGNSPEQSVDKSDSIPVNNVRKGSNVFGDFLLNDINAINYCSALKQKDNMKQMLDVTNTTVLHQWHEIDTKYVSSHHNRSQSVRTPGSKSNVQVAINGTSRYRPNYLCLPQQRTRVASMPNTGVEEDFYRLRQFSISSKGIINRGDSLKSRRSRSNTSVASSNSSHSTEQVTVCGTTAGGVSVGNCSSQCGTASVVPSLPSSRESSCASCPGITPPFRVVMLGSCGVGKSSLVSQFMTSEYLQATGISIDEDFGEKSVCVSLDNEESEIVFIDQPSSKNISPVDLSNYESPHGYCVVYSTSDRNSFEHAESYLRTLWTSESIRTKAVILVGNKTDLVRIRAVSTEEGTKMATAYDCKFIETSVGINHNVDELLVGILTQIRLKLDNPPDPSIPRDQYNAKKRSRSPLSNCGPRLYRGSKTTASLRVKQILSKVWSINSKSKSCENLHVL